MNETNSKTLFADALFTYIPHPGTALCVGYIGNFANIDRALFAGRPRSLSQAARPFFVVICLTESTLLMIRGGSQKRDLGKRLCIPSR